MFAFGNTPRTPNITTGVTAPTTATAGQLGDVRFDTDGNQWNLKYINGNTYYWSPDDFPADNTEYFHFYNKSYGGIIYKKRMSGISIGGALTTNIAHGIIGFGKIHQLSAGIFEYSTGFFETIGGYVGASAFTNFACDASNLIIQSGTSFYNKPVVFDLYYTKV